MRELEVKFYLEERKALERRIKKLGARQVRGRVHEYNLRFDTPQGDLERSRVVLRLRRDDANHLTYKGSGREQAGVSSRQEIEFRVEDFDSARALLEALGYQVSVIYEKYRTTYQLGSVTLTLDEMPYGDFIELEGSSAEKIHALHEPLGLDWEARILENYLVLFDRLRSNLNLSFSNLTFANFEGIHVTPEALGVRPAD